MTGCQKLKQTRKLYVCEKGKWKLRMKRTEFERVIKVILLFKYDLLGRYGQEPMQKEVEATGSMYIVCLGGFI